MKLSEQILSARDLQEEQVHIPEWDVDLIIRELTGAQRDRLESESVRIDGKGNVTAVRSDNLRAKIVILSTYDGDGNRVFEDSDLDSLLTKSASVLDRIADVAMRLSGMTQKAAEELGEG